MRNLLKRLILWALTDTYDDFCVHAYNGDTRSKVNEAAIASLARSMDHLHDLDKLTDMRMVKLEEKIEYVRKVARG